MSALLSFVVLSMGVAISCGPGGGNSNQNGSNTNANDGGFTLQITGAPVDRVGIGTTVTLTAQVQNAAGQIDYVWSWGPGEEGIDAQLNGIDQETIQFLPFETGDYTVSVTITDSATGLSLTDEVVIVVNQGGPPVGE